MYSKRTMPLYVSLPPVDLIFTIILFFKTKLFIEKSRCFTFSNDHSYETALLLSVFLGMCGIDRFYLGYPAIGQLQLQLSESQPLKCISYYRKGHVGVILVDDNIIFLNISTGLLKFCTLGFFFVFHLVDVILIATQVNNMSGS